MATQKGVKLNKIKKTIILLIIIIIILTGILIYSIKNKKISIENTLDSQIVSNTEEYFMVDNLLQKYYSYLYLEEYEKAYNLLDKQYIEKYEITQEKLKEEIEKQYSNFKPQKIYLHEFDKYSKMYFVKGISYKITSEKKTKNIEQDNYLDKPIIYEQDELEKREYKDAYYIAKIDYINKTFSISKDIQKYDNVFNNM